jgi:ribosome-binding protein aMBF1 (putative translation factor)
MNIYGSAASIDVPRRAVDFRAIASKAASRRAFGTLVREAREEFGLGQRELARELYCRVEQIEDIETGDSPSLTLMAKVVNWLGIEASQ